MISYQKWRDRRDWFSVSWRVMKMNDTFRKRSVWIERGRPRWSHIYVWTFLFNSISLGIEIGNLESTNPLGSYLFWFYAPRHAMFEMKRHQKRLRKRKQPRRKRRRKIGLETRWTMICFYMIMNYDTYIYTSYLKWIRLYLVCVYIFCCKKKWVQVQLGMVGFLVLPMFLRAHAFCVRCDTRSYQKPKDPNCTVE